MTIGVNTSGTYQPEEIRGPGAAEQFLAIPCIIENGQNLDKGTVIGKRPTSEKYVAYDDSAAASATSPQAGTENTGGGSCSAIQVQDAYTLTENWTLTCTAEQAGGGTFSVVGSISGNVGNATVGSEFKYPNDGTYMLKFTISDGDPDFVTDDTFAFSTTAAGARTATGILTEKKDASSGDEISTMFIRGNFIESKLTGIDANAKTDMSARTVADYLLL